MTILDWVILLLPSACVVSFFVLCSYYWPRRNRRCGHNDAVVVDRYFKIGAGGGKAKVVCRICGQVSLVTVVQYDSGIIAWME